MKALVENIYFKVDMLQELSTASEVLLEKQISQDMSISDCDKYDDINNCWTSSDTEHSLSKMSSGDSLDEIDDKMNSDNAPESNVAANMRYDRKNYQYLNQI
ncbi:hypothetical protein DINM_001749 [Dirofilaria immitis]|nr:hypothetical protein [Dirofilaria immitis]